MVEIKELDGDIINAPPEYYMLDFISADQAIDTKLAPIQPQNVSLVGRAIMSGKKFSLITKEHYRDIAQSYILRVALIALRNQCALYGVTKLALQKAGYGLNRLNWSDVRHIIVDVFDHMDIEVLAYSGI